MKKFGIILIILGLLAAVGWEKGVDLPTLSWFFDVHRIFGHVCSALMVGLGLWLTLKEHKPMKPMTVRRVKRFKSIRRGYVSLWILFGMLLIAGLDQLVVGKRALMVKHDGEFYFPALSQKDYKGEEFDLKGESAIKSANYRLLKKQYEDNKSDNWVLMPFIPFDPTEDTVSAVSQPVETRDNIVYDPRTDKPFSGLAATLYDKENPESIHVRYKFRDGIRKGEATGRSETKQNVYSAFYVDGKPSKERYEGEGTVAEFLGQDVTNLRIIHYAPSPPIASEGHYLGTNSKGDDIIAYLFGGLQVNFKAAIIYIPLVYIIGISVGLLMGFFGGTFDIIVQRLIEIFSNIPFLFVIIILSGMIEAEYRGLGLILTILVVFGWMGMTYLMRTAALKEKARDYVAAARVMGASTPRILFQHILPNSVAILVTLVPFSVSGIVLSLTSLDYLGFGLPAKYATWGRLLSDGLDNLSSPWVVSGAFFMLVTLLILVTFIGEAIREAFDPKKFTTYQ